MQILNDFKIYLIRRVLQKQNLEKMTVLILIVLWKQLIVFIVTTQLDWLLKTLNKIKKIRVKHWI